MREGACVGHALIPESMKFMDKRNEEVQFCNSRFVICPNASKMEIPFEISVKLNAPPIFEKNSSKK